MDQPSHPLTRDPGALRLLAHNLVDAEELLGADSFSIDGAEIVFRRRAAPDRPATTWRGKLGDWLIHDADGQWLIVTDEPTTPLGTSARRGAIRTS